MHSTDALRISGDTIYLYKANGTYESVTITDDNTNNYLNSASFNTGNGVLTLGRSGLSAVTVDLDGRYQAAGSYQPAGNYDNYSYWKISDGSNSENITSTQTLKIVGSGASSTSYNASTNTLTISSTDTNTDTNTNNYVSSASFSTSNGVLTLNRSGLGAVTVDLDGRYSQTDTNTNYYINAASFNTGNGILSLTGVGTSASVDLDGRYQIAGSYQAAGSYVTTSSVQALHSTDALRISGDTIYLYKANGTYESVTITDDNTNNYLNSASFSTTNGVLTLNRSGLGAVTVDLDGRYSTTDTNTTYSAGVGLDLSGTQFRLENDLRNDVDYIGGSGSTNYIDMSSSAQFKIIFDGVEDFRFSDGGNFHADGNICAYSTTTTSDERLKENIQVVENPIEKLQQIRGVEFDWKENGEKSAGVIAQDVEKVLPQAVKEFPTLDSKGEGEMIKSVNYDAIQSLLIESVKEQQKQIEELKAEIASLKG